MGVQAVKDSPWKETAWNGIRFMAPAGWEPASIGRRYLMLENDAGPVLEIKWGPIKGSFSHRKHFRRLSKNFSKQSNIRIEERPLPNDWEAALGRYEHSGFSWTGNRLGGRGVILYCPICTHATLIQFYDYPAQTSDRVYVKTLRSFEDHPPNNETVWAVFDFRAVVPDAYRLNYHRFEPGRFELSFESGRQKLTLYRWGPAGAALSNRTLVQFAQMMVPILKGKDRFHISDNGNRVDFDENGPFGKTSFWQRFKREKSTMTVRIWHEQKRNKILGIRFEGNASTASLMMESLSKRYETL
jgi:hypothetical protein